MLPPREGLFNAYPVEIGIDETGPHKLATCLIRFRLYEEFQASGEWADCAGEKWEITGYFYLEKKDGTLNTVAIDALKAALGWACRSPRGLAPAGRGRAIFTPARTGRSGARRRSWGRTST